jgi:hypothetical protein
LFPTVLKGIQKYEKIKRVVGAGCQRLPQPTWARKFNADPLLLCRIASVAAYCLRHAVGSCPSFNAAPSAPLSFPFLSVEKTQLQFSLFFPRLRTPLRLCSPAEANASEGYCAMR